MLLRVRVVQTHVGVDQPVPTPLEATGLLTILQILQGQRHAPCADSETRCERRQTATKAARLHRRSVQEQDPSGPCRRVGSCHEDSMARRCPLEGNLPKKMRKTKSTGPSCARTSLPRIETFPSPDQAVAHERRSNPSRNGSELSVTNETGWDQADSPTIDESNPVSDNMTPPEVPSLSYGGYVPIPTRNITYPPYDLFTAAADDPARTPGNRGSAAPPPADSTQNPRLRRGITEATYDSPALTADLRDKPAAGRRIARKRHWRQMCAAVTAAVCWIDLAGPDPAATRGPTEGSRDYADAEEQRKKKRRIEVAVERSVLGKKLRKAKGDFRKLWGAPDDNG